MAETGMYEDGRAGEGGKKGRIREKGRREGREGERGGDSALVVYNSIKGHLAQSALEPL